VGLSDGIRTRIARRRGRWTYGPLESPAPEATDEKAADPVPETSTEPAKADGRTGQSGPVVVNDPAETKPDSEVAVATTTTPEFDRAVPRGLQIAASWSWRVLLVVALIGGIGWLTRYLSAVMVPVAVAILLAALLSPVANRLRSWGLHSGLATAITVLGGMALIAGSLYLIGAQIAGQASTLSTNVVQGFNQLLDFLRNGPLPVPDSWLSSSDWVDRIQNFLRDS
jgi:putative heme transporter